MGMFDFLGGGGDPMKEANKYLEKIPGQMGQYMDPYIGAGKGALSELMKQYGGLLHDPGAMYKQFGQGFQQSPGYQFQLGEGQRAMNQGAAAGGMLGSPQEQAQLAQYSQGLANQDYQNYMHQILGMYGQGLQGMGGINQMGYGASGTMAQGLKEMLESQAGGAYANAASKNQGMSNLLGGLGGGALGFMTGGPAGAASGAGKAMGWF